MAHRIGAVRGVGARSGGVGRKFGAMGLASCCLALRGGLEGRGWLGQGLVEGQGWTSGRAGSGSRAADRLRLRRDELFRRGKGTAVDLEITQLQAAQGPSQGLGPPWLP